MDKKTEYLYKTFSTRTFGKQKENYVVNAIWQRLNRLDICPETQKCVRFFDKKDGKYKHALIDLYFPQIKLGIECDEEYHSDDDQYYKDIRREESIYEVFNAINETDFTIKRVNAGNNVSIEQLHKNIDEIVEYIEKRISERQIIPWKTYEEELEYIKKTKKIKVSDMYVFDVHTDIQDIFNLDVGFSAGGCSRLIKNTNTNEPFLIWTPRLGILNSDTIQTVNGWKNYLSGDMETITEYNEDRKKKNVYSFAKRVVFAHCKNSFGKDGYRFIGIYRFYHENEDGVRTYKRESDEITLDFFECIRNSKKIEKEYIQNSNSKNCY